MTKNLTKFTSEKILIFFWIKISIATGIPWPPERTRPSYRKRLQPPKENIQHFKT
jgi:hypothetical protein